MKLNIGDMIYFPPHNALGILLSCYRHPEGHNIWKYSLRSATKKDLSYHLVNVYEVQEYRILESIESGFFEYYSAKNEKTN